MVTMITKTRMSIAEYLALSDDEPPWLEYIGGEVVEKPLPNIDHGIVAGRLARVLGNFEVEAGGQTVVEVRSRFDDPDDPRYMLPDVSFFRRGTRMRDGRMGLSPTLAIEIRSPGQTLAFLRSRCRYYLDHGVEEAWIIEPEAGRLEVWDGERDGIVVSAGEVRSSSLPGFSLLPTALFTGLEAEYA